MYSTYSKPIGACFFIFLFFSNPHLPGEQATLFICRWPQTVPDFDGGRLIGPPLPANC